MMGFLSVIHVLMKSAFKNFVSFDLNKSQLSSFTHIAKKKIANKCVSFALYSETFANN